MSYEMTFSRARLPASRTPATQRRRESPSRPTTKTDIIHTQKHKICLVCVTTVEYSDGENIKKAATDGHRNGCYSLNALNALNTFDL